MTRRTDRHDYAIETRVGLLESDMDEHDRIHAELKDEIRGLKGVLIGILTATATASILLAINIAIQVGG